MSKNKSTPAPGMQHFWPSLKRIFGLSKPYRKRFYIATLLALGSSAVGLSVPLGLKALLDAVFSSSNGDLLNIIALVLFGLFIFQAFLSLGSSYWLEWVGERVVTDLRKAMYGHLHELGFRYFSDKRLGEITSRLTNDVSSVRTALTDSLPQVLTVIFSLLGSLILMLLLNWRLCLIVLVTVPLVTFASRYFGNKIRKLARGIQDELANSTAVAEEALGAVRIVKAFAREAYEIGRYSDAVERLFRTSRRKILLDSLFYSGIGALFMSTLVIIFWYGGREVLAGRLTTGDLVAFIFYAFAIARSVGQMSRLYTSMTSAVGASDRIFELLEEKPEINDSPNAIRLEKVKGRVTFDNVIFNYDEGRPALTNIAFEVEPGETIAVVGPSGAGKTTLINLIPRFYDPNEGAVLVDNIDIKTVQKKSLREQVAIVPQDVHLFGTSIGENIRYGRLDATDEEVQAAAIDANAWEFISEHPLKLEAKIGERGVKLSGGQRQRMAIARAILKNPRILLLDEATSSLDSESEAEVQKALNRLMENRTTFIIAHRLSTVQHADRIFVLDHGQIVQGGTHRELLAEAGLYKQLYELQFRDEAVSS